MNGWVTPTPALTSSYFLDPLGKKNRGEGEGLMRRRLTEAMKRQVAASNGWVCALCSVTVQSTYQIDHIVPLWEGGRDHVENAQLLCCECHARKTQAEAIRRGERKRRLREGTIEGNTRRPALECTGCGVVFSPYFVKHTCLS